MSNKQDVSVLAQASLSKAHLSGEIMGMFRSIAMAILAGVGVWLSFLVGNPGQIIAVWLFICLGWFLIFAPLFTPGISFHKIWTWGCIGLGIYATFHLHGSDIGMAWGSCGFLWVLQFILFGAPNYSDTRLEDEARAQDEDDRAQGVLDQQQMWDDQARWEEERHHHEY